MTRTELLRRAMSVLGSAKSSAKAQAARRNLEKANLAKERLKAALSCHGSSGEEKPEETPIPLVYGESGNE
jgi:hypothetical protein